MNLNVIYRLQILPNSTCVLVLCRYNGGAYKTNKVMAEDRDEMDYFGSSVAVSGGYFIAGAYGGTLLPMSTMTAAWRTSLQSTPRAAVAAVAAALEGPVLNRATFCEMTAGSKSVVRTHSVRRTSSGAASLTPTAAPPPRTSAASPTPRVLLVLRATFLQKTPGSAVVGEFPSSNTTRATAHTCLHFSVLI
jgi:hypothetical protein